jgi:hypothetical protein
MKILIKGDVVMDEKTYQIIIKMNETAANIKRLNERILDNTSTIKICNERIRICSDERDILEEQFEKLRKELIGEKA